MPEILGIHHVQVVTTQLDDALARWTGNLGLDCIDEFTRDEIRGARIPLGDIELQIIQPSMADRLDAALDARFEGLLSLGLRVADLERFVIELRGKGVDVGDPQLDAAFGLRSARIAARNTFGMPIELVDAPSLQSRIASPPLLVEHIGIVVPNLQDALPLYRDALDLPVHSSMELEDFVVKLFFASCPNTELEILEPLSAQSSLYPYVSRPPDGLHHLCFRTDDIHRVLADLKRKGVPLIHDEVQDHGTPCFFVAPEAHRGVVLEFLEPA